MDISHQELDELFEKYRQSPKSYVFVLLADACRKIGRAEEALDICRSGIENHPSYASAYVVQGKCFYDLERKDEALESFKRVLQFDANNLVALKYIGMIEAEFGDLDAARERFQHILALDPENKQILEALQTVEEKQSLSEPVSPAGGAAAPNDTAEAETEDLGDEEDKDYNDEKEPGFSSRPIKIGEDVESSDELASITLGDIFAEQGYLEKAKKIYEELLEVRPNSHILIDKLTRIGFPPQTADAVESTVDTVAEEPPQYDDVELPAAEPQVVDEEVSTAGASHEEAVAREESPAPTAEESVSEPVQPAPELAEEDEFEPLSHGEDERSTDADEWAPLPKAQPPRNQASVEHTIIELGYEDEELDEDELVGFEESSRSRRQKPMVTKPHKRRQIDENESLTHFRRWVSQMRD